ncbi:MAG: hypothetical protein BJ554DRAFT_2737 [Olpidium bornovanus]|uniref:Uncharacterized protein n=1 Tax=Olpidium bornovanus TaxID=278681 RepID=A0A8H8DLH9_9FUNG|nr:MAG: hypothetical protein BJ554DRAFT_2737 [Olpidium bornovanus]
MAGNPIDGDIKLDQAVALLEGKAAKLWMAHAVKHPDGSLTRWTSWVELKQALRKRLYPFNMLVLKPVLKPSLPSK